MVPMPGNSHVKIPSIIMDMNHQLSICIGVNPQLGIGINVVVSVEHYKIENKRKKVSSKGGLCYTGLNLIRQKVTGH